MKGLGIEVWSFGGEKVLDLCLKPGSSPGAEARLEQRAPFPPLAMRALEQAGSGGSGAFTTIQWST